MSSVRLQADRGRTMRALRSLGIIAAVSVAIPIATTIVGFYAHMVWGDILFGWSLYQ